MCHVSDILASMMILGRTAVFLYAENWPSGRRRTLGKRVRGRPLRGFESHVLRHLSEGHMRIVFVVAVFSFLSISTYSIEYFPKNYKEARKKFIDLSIANGGQLSKELIRSKIDNDLTIDVSYFPAKVKKEKIIIITSGIHGPESYLGSAAQILFLSKYLDKMNRTNTSVLLVHSLNPYGFKYGRRTNEDNIDLNRNLSIDKDIFNIKNSGHSSMLDVLSPEGEVDSMFLSNFIWSLIKKLVSGLAISEVRNGITSGQYKHPKSIYFGGTDFSQQRNFLMKLYKKVIPAYSQVLALDLHTGLGEKGTLHLISGGKDYLSSSSIKQQQKTFFDKSEKFYKLTTADTPGFYSTTGDMNDFLASICGKEKLVVALTAEFGTMGLSLPRQIQSLNRMIKENQGHFWGYSDNSVKKTVKDSFIELFNPDDEEWKLSVIRSLDRIFSTELNKFVETL